MEELLPAETFVVLTKKAFLKDKICNFIVYEVFIKQRVYSLSNQQKVTYQCSVGSFRLVHSTWMSLSICTCSGVTMSTSFHFLFSERQLTRTRRDNRAPADCRPTIGEDTKVWWANRDIAPPPLCSAQPGCSVAQQEQSEEALMSARAFL